MGRVSSLPSPAPTGAAPLDHGLRSALPSTIERLEEAAVLRLDEARSWLVTAALVVLGLLTRVVGIGTPAHLEFDETYYAKDAWTLLHLGYEGTWGAGADDQIAAGHVDGWTSIGSFIVHPQLGKWLIAGGERLFGMTPLGWRFASLVFGCLLIGAVVRMARRLGRSTLIGALAGFFIIVDGLSFVMSRIALLDVFEAFFTVAAVGCWLADRDWFRHRLAEHLRANGLLNLGGGYGPLLLWRPWRLACGLLLGAACGCKWNAVYVLAVLGVLSLVDDRRARLTAGAGRQAIRRLWRDGLSAVVHLAVAALVVYVATWTSWLLSDGGYDRQWGAQHPADRVTRLLGDGLGSLWHYHYDIYAFHTGGWIASQTHTYDAKPLGWPVMARVIGIDAVNGIQPGEDGCTAVNDTCLRVVSGAGTPFLWWFACLAVVVGLFLWIGGRQWHYCVPIVVAAATWLMWFPSSDRPTFFFYAIMLIPFTATVLAMVLGRILGPADAPPPRRRRGALIVTAVTVLITANFLFIYPILTDALLTRRQWFMRMWFTTWI